MKKKITTGFVIQTFDDDGKCVKQEFVAGDQVDWEDDNGKPIMPHPPHQYQPFNMYVGFPDPCLKSSGVDDETE